MDMDNADNSKQRGLLVVIEGLDRSGKSSQCQQLFQALESRGRRVRYVKFPDRTTTTGQMINSYLTNKAQQDDHSIHLLFSANRWEAIKGIQDDLADGTTVIIDRYSFSGAVYSAAKENPDLSLDWAWYPEIGLLKPDVCFFLDISSAAAANRGGYGAERYETEKMQSRVRLLFNELFSRLDHVFIQAIDAGRTKDEVAGDIMAGIVQVSQKGVALGPLRKLGPLLTAA